MITEYQIANFKAFGSTQTMPIRPITLIFGPNSSGKSSIFQSLLMLKQTFEGTVRGTREDTLELSLKGHLVDLGSYKNWIFRNDLNKYISFSIVTRMPKDIIQTFESETIREELSKYQNLYQRNKLSKLISNINKIGMKFTYNYDVLYYGQLLKDLILLIDEEWIISLKEGSISSIEFMDILNFPSYLVYKINEKHDLWKKYWEIFDQDDSTFINKIIDHYLNFNQEFFPEDYNRDFNHDYKRIINILIDQSDKQFSKRYKGNLLDFLAKEKKRLKKLHGFELAMQAYKLSLLFVIFNEKRLLKPYISNYEIIDLLFREKEPDVQRNIANLFFISSYLIKSFFENLYYIGPLRDYPTRIYEINRAYRNYVGKSGSFFPSILATNKIYEEKINTWFERLEISYKLEVIPVSSTYDDLYSISLLDKKTNVHVGLTDVGFGVSQVLPVIVQSVVSQGKTILIEQPEYHLHPRLQAELGDMFIESALGEQKNTFLIETHSEHLILRILRRIRETSEGTLPEGATPITPDQVSVVYVQPGPEGSQIIPLPITKDGEFARPRPEGFFADRAQELM
jgi:AAA15 family ATPase/GTPase